VFGRFTQLEISVIGCPLKATGFGDTVTLTAPVPAPGAGDGEGEGVGEGAGDGEEPGTTPLLERDGTPPLATGDGDVGSTEPQLIVASASRSETGTMSLRMRGGYARRAPGHVGRKLHSGAAQCRTPHKRCNAIERVGQIFPRAAHEEDRCSR
jgi:hypothetical protein